MEKELFDQKRLELIEIIQSMPYEGHVANSDIKGLNFYRITEPTEVLATVYDPSLCIIAQGAKEVGIGDDLLGYNPFKYLLASIHMPAHVRVPEASPDKPYLGLSIKFSLEQIFEIMKEIETPVRSAKPQRGLYFGNMDSMLFDAIMRLVRLQDRPKDIPILAPLILKEILYIVMSGDGGHFIRQYVMDGSATQRIVQVITKIKNNFTEMLNITELSKSVGMSESSLYHNFKEITAMSPLQFQKTLRLQEARRMLLTQHIDASQVAFQVGYESPSQFSREYTRMFGLPPKADVKRLKDGTLEIE